MGNPHAIQMDAPEQKCVVLEQHSQMELKGRLTFLSLSFDAFMYKGCFARGYH